MTLKKENGFVFLVNDDEIRQLKEAIIEVDKNLRTLSEKVGEAHFQTNKTYLFGVVREGKEFILNDEEKKVRKWTKDSPLAESSIRRLANDARQSVPEELIETIEGITYNISRLLEGYPVSNWVDYLDYNDKDSVVCLSPKYYEDNEKLICRKISDAELVDVEDFLEMLPRLQDLSDKGYQILDSTGIAYNGMPFPISGLVTSFTKRVNDLSEREDIDKDELTLAMVTRRGKSLDAIKEAKRREEE